MFPIKQNFKFILLLTGPHIYPTLGDALKAQLSIRFLLSKIFTFVKILYLYLLLQMSHSAYLNHTVMLS